MREAFTLMQGPMHRIDRRLGPRLRPLRPIFFRSAPSMQDFSATGLAP